MTIVVASAPRVRGASRFAAPWIGALGLCAFTSASVSAGPAVVPPVDSSAIWEHRVEPGDTLIGLHSRLLRPEADWRVIQRLNRVANPRRLQPGSTLLIPISMLREQALQAEIVHVHGTVTLIAADGSSRALTASAGLQAGDQLVTGAQSSASLRFADGAVTLIGPGSRVRLNGHSRLGDGRVVGTRLQIETGSTETRVPPATPSSRFELQTPKAKLGVRGTDFRGRVDGDQVLAEVQTGRVAVGPQSVPAGFGTVATDAGVTTPTPLLPAPDLSATPERIERIPLQIALPAIDGASRYRARIFNPAVPDQLLIEGLFDRPLAAWADDLPDARYELRVRAADGQGIEGFESRRAFVLKARPEPPLPTRPRSGHRQYDNTVEFAWSRHPQAARYRVQVSPSTSFQELAVDRSDLTEPQLQIPLPAGRYQWRIATIRADGDQGPWGDPRELVREEPPPTPVPQPPKLSDEGLALSWPTSPLPGSRYQLQIARDAAFTQLVVDETLESNEHLLRKPQPGVYHVRVRAVAPDGWRGPFSSAQTIEVPRVDWWLWFLPLLLLL